MRKFSICAILWYGIKNKVKHKMKTILCFGDSNTFGYNPLDGSRYDENSRWSRILKNKLSENFEIIEEGLNNRTGFVDNKDGFFHSSQRCFSKILNSYKNIDILILAIGTNDLQFLYDVNFKTIERGLEYLTLEAKEKCKNIIIVPPVILNKNVLSGNFSHQFDITSIEKSKKVSRIYKKICNVYQCKYFDFNNLAEPSDADGLHYTKEGHEKIAEELSEFILKENL